MAQAPPSKVSRWADRLSRSSFFVGALLFHLLVFLMVATYIIWPAPPAPPPPSDIVYVQPVANTPPPPPKTPDAPVNPTSPDQPPVAIIVPHGTPSSFPAHLPDISMKGRDHTPPEPPRVIISNEPGLDLRMPAIRTLVERYHDPLTTTGPRDLETKPFPVYVAAYANGDWGCNTRLDKNGNIYAGAIPDLVAKINEWSHGNIKGYVVPKPLDIGGPELMDKMPPFIFFTGHKDFTLTDREIENLRQYLQIGGAIWGDNAMAGAGSRFDVAFRREMKRVVSDRDKNFVPYTLDDPIFTKSYYPIEKVPSGMNYYAELPQHLDIDGKLAIIYTPNDYSDIMFMRVLPGDKEVYVPDPEKLLAGTLFTDYDFWGQRAIFYRNFDLDSALAVHRLGMNIVAYLLVRFDDQLQLGQ